MDQVRVVTEAHHYNFWANYKIYEGREFTMDRDIADELVARGLIKIIEQKKSAPAPKKAKAEEE